MATSISLYPYWHCSANNHKLADAISTTWSFLHYQYLSDFPGVDLGEFPQKRRLRAGIQIISSFVRCRRSENQIFGFFFGTFVTCIWSQFGITASQPEPRLDSNLRIWDRETKLYGTGMKERKHSSNFFLYTQVLVWPRVGHNDEPAGNLAGLRNGQVNLDVSAPMYITMERG